MYSNELRRRGRFIPLNKKKKEQKQYIEESVIKKIFTQICISLHHVHKKKILHRDLKTQNIFLTKEKNVKLGDFGISRVLQHTYDLAQTAIGTPYYLSPEICQEKPYNHKSDVWSIGCILYEMLSLNHAFDSDSMKGLIVKILQGNYPPPPSSYSEEVLGLLNLLLKTDPNQRPSVEGILRMGFIREEVHRLERLQGECFFVYGDCDQGVGDKGLDGFHNGGAYRRKDRNVFDNLNELKDIRVEKKSLREKKIKRSKSFLINDDSKKNIRREKNKISKSFSKIKNNKKKLNFLNEKSKKERLNTLLNERKDFIKSKNKKKTDEINKQEKKKYHKKSLVERLTGNMPNMKNYKSTNKTEKNNKNDDINKFYSQQKEIQNEERKNIFNNLKEKNKEDLKILFKKKQKFEIHNESKKSPKRKMEKISSKKNLDKLSKNSSKKKLERRCKQSSKTNLENNNSRKKILNKINKNHNSIKLIPKTGSPEKLKQFSKKMRNVAKSFEKKPKFNKKKNNLNNRAKTPDLLSMNNKKKKNKIFKFLEKSNKKIFNNKDEKSEKTFENSKNKEINKLISDIWNNNDIYENEKKEKSIKSETNFKKEKNIKAKKLHTESYYEKDNYKNKSEIKNSEVKQNLSNSEKNKKIINSEILTKKENLTEDEKIKIFLKRSYNENLVIEDEPLNSTFLFKGLPINVDKTDTITYKIEALRIYMEKELTLERLLILYNKIRDLEIFNDLSLKEEKFLPFINQLIFLEDRAFIN